MIASIRRLTAQTALSAIFFALFLALTLALTACGGGGDSGQDTAPPNETADDYLVPLFSFDDANGGGQVHLYDPVNMGSPRRSLPLQAHMDVLSASRINAASREVTTFGSSMLIYIEDARLYSLSLRRTDSNVPSRISSIDNACALLDVHPIGFGVSPETLIAYEDAGPDNNCNQSGDNRKAFIKNSATSSQAPMYLPASHTLVGVLRDDTNGALMHLLMMDDSQIGLGLSGIHYLRLYSTELNRVAEVAITGGLRTFEFLDDLDSAFEAGHRYVQVDDTIRRLSWTAQSVSLSLPLHTFADRDTAAFGLRLGDVQYFSEGPAVYKVSLGSPAEYVGSFPSDGGDRVELIAATHQHLIAFQSNATGGNKVMRSLPKSGGSPVTLLAAGNNVFVDESEVSAIGNDVVYRAYIWNGLTSEGTLRRIPASGGATEVITGPGSAGLVEAGAVYSSTASRLAGNRLSMSHIVSCQSLDNCATGGALRLHDLTGTSSLALGTTDAPRPTISGMNHQWVSVYARSGNALPIHSAFHPDRLNSLVRLSLPSANESLLSAR